MPLQPGSYVFCERESIREICKDTPGIHIEHEDVVLEGYQIYLVEQWAIERNREVSTAVSFTGDPVHTIHAIVIAVDQPSVDCPRLEKVLDLLRVAKARAKETPYGQLFVTNLSSFASSLNIVLVPKDGNFDTYRRRFYLNLNLRRMGCSGRSALTLKPPSDAQREKFNQLYRISDSTDFEATVIRLSALVQNCLVVFGLFNLQHVDGLLCDATEMGLSRFYEMFLSSKMQRPSTETVLDPGVLAGMFSKLSNIRGKLQHLVNNVPKDPFAEPVAFLSAVKSFQSKKSELTSGELDVKTADAISAAYQSSFNPQGLKVHKVLKSKIEDFSGMTTTNTEGETMDLEVFAKNIHSDSLKQVWRGKTKHKPDMADALASGDWLTGGKELGRSLVRGLAKTKQETKMASQSLKTIATGKSRQSLQIPKGKQGPIAGLKEGNMTDDTLAAPIQQELANLKSDDERSEEYESEVAPMSVVTGTTQNNGSEEETSVTTTVDPSKPDPPEPPVIKCFNLTGRRGLRRSLSMTAIQGQGRARERPHDQGINSRNISGLSLEPLWKESQQPDNRKRSLSYSSQEYNKPSNAKQLSSLVVECDPQTYFLYHLLKEKEESLRVSFQKLQLVEQDLTAQLESLSAIVDERSFQFEEIEREAMAILAERRELMTEVLEKEHATQRSVYNLEGMIGKLIEMRDFTGAFFDKISYLDTKLPASQRRLALWMDKLQALQSQWFRTIGGYVMPYAPQGVRTRFLEWERDVQLATAKARETRSDVDYNLVAGTLSSGSVTGASSHTLGAAGSNVHPSRAMSVGSSGLKSSYHQTNEAMHAGSDTTESGITKRGMMNNKAALTL
ncbi:hypothetical protein BGW38_009396 [Lunasporangiospora selenospora]|uniref:STB6-like N-terminal domain-containing protein n=1 Tax=Lunasporangiospora selenospora TaxID=979761 RepID=A0A9P6G3E6_9FUNG|nr:hypothetical protein BGW38_009396 [Lunasporangiospora selenospora]